MTTSIKIVQEFGLEISIGVMIAWLISILVVPSGILIQNFYVKKKRFFLPILSWLSNSIPNNPRIYFNTLALVVILFLQDKRHLDKFISYGRSAP